MYKYVMQIGLQVRTFGNWIPRVSLERAADWYFFTWCPAEVSWFENSWVGLEILEKLMPRLDFFSIRWKVAHIFPLECTGLFGSHLHVRTPKISWIVQQVTVWKLWRWNLQWVWQVKNSRRFNWIHYSSSIATWQCMTTTTLEWSFVEIMRNTVRSNHVKSLQFLTDQSK